MKSGETRYLVQKIDITRPYDFVRFRLSNSKNTIKKTTNDGVVERDGVFLIPLYQADTVALQGSVSIEAEVVYQDKSNRYTDFENVYINQSLGWDAIQDNAPSQDDGVELVLESIENGVAVIISPESEQELIDGVMELFNDTKAIAQSVRDDADNGEFDGFSPTIEVESDTASEYILEITDVHGSYLTPNLKGSGGGGGTSDYTELSNKPQINNVELVGNKTLGNLGLYSKTEIDNIELSNGRTLDVSINSSTFVCTFALKNGNGETLSSGSIDLPLESVVVSGEYNAQTKKVVLTLQNGSTIEFSIADLVDGLVSTSDLQTILADYQPLITVTGHGSINNGTLNIDASKTWFGTDTSDRISDRGGDYDGIAVGDLYVVTVNYQSIVKVVTSVGESQGVPYFDVKPVDNTIVSSSARPNNITDHQGHNIELGCVWVDTTNSRVSILKSYTGTASETVFNWIDLSSGGSYSAGDGIDITNGTISVDIKSGSALTITSGELDVDLSNKQDTIDSTHKLSADLVDDTSATNKFVPSHSSTESGKVLGVDSQGGLNWVAQSGGTTYSGGDGIDITNDTISVDLKSGTELQITSGELDIDLSNYATTTSVSSKEDKTTINTDTSSTTPTLALANNTEQRYTQDLTSLTLTLPQTTPSDFITSVVFASGSTPTTMTYDSSIKWSGDDVTSNAFVPSASKTYNIVFWYDGININAVVRGVA